MVLGQGAPCLARKHRAAPRTASATRWRALTRLAAPPRARAPPLGAAAAGVVATALQHAVPVCQWPAVQAALSCICCSCALSLAMTPSSKTAALLQTVRSQLPPDIRADKRISPRMSRKPADAESSSNLPSSPPRRGDSSPCSGATAQPCRALFEAQPRGLDELARWGRAILLSAMSKQKRNCDE